MQCPSLQRLSYGSPVQSLKLRASSRNVGLPVCLLRIRSESEEAEGRSGKSGKSGSPDRRAVLYGASKPRFLSSLVAFLAPTLHPCSAGQGEQGAACPRSGDWASPRRLHWHH